ncbi:hypothetical protein [Saccharopolyspora sp. 7B]|nr:hypothetical protein [Saccharopolyspora sp. 7B]MCA1280373.1 hypothetical protein [Saccharopolyspora sp. 7B]
MRVGGSALVRFCLQDPDAVQRMWDRRGTGSVNAPWRTAVRSSSATAAKR